MDERRKYEVNGESGATDARQVRSHLPVALVRSVATALSIGVETFQTVSGCSGASVRRQDNRNRERRSQRSVKEVVTSGAVRACRGIPNLGANRIEAATGLRIQSWYRVPR